MTPADAAVVVVTGGQAGDMARTAVTHRVQTLSPMTVHCQPLKYAERARPERAGEALMESARKAAQRCW